MKYTLQKEGCKTSTSRHESYLLSTHYVLDALGILSATLPQGRSHSYFRQKPGLRILVICLRSKEEKHHGQHLVSPTVCFQFQFDPGAHTLHSTSHVYYHEIHKTTLWASSTNDTHQQTGQSYTIAKPDPGSLTFRTYYSTLLEMREAGFKPMCECNAYILCIYIKLPFK